MSDECPMCTGPVTTEPCIHETDAYCLLCENRYSLYRSTAADRNHDTELRKQLTNAVKQLELQKEVIEQLTHALYKAERRLDDIIASHYCVKTDPNVYIECPTCKIIDTKKRI